MAGWFDDLARSSAARSEERTSRRRFLRQAAAAAGGVAAATVLGAQPAFARTRRCPRGEHWCGNGCVNFQCDPLHCGGCDDVCPPNQACIGGDCHRCPPGTVLCGADQGCNAACVDTNTNSNNCGRCGVVCPPGSSCCGGICCAGCCDSTGVCRNGNTRNFCGSGGGACVDCGAMFCFGSVCGIGE